MWPLEGGGGEGTRGGGAHPRVRQLGRGAGGLLLVALAEALDAAGRVDQLLLAGEEGVALAADLDPQLLLGGAGRPGLAAGAVDQDLVELGVECSVSWDGAFYGSGAPGASPAPGGPPGLRSVPGAGRVESPTLRDDVFYLYVTAPGMAARKVSLDRPVTTIGRSSMNDLPISDKMLSRQHARIVRDNDGGLTVEDLGSRNGTFLNGERLDDRSSP